MQPAPPCPAPNCWWQMQRLGYFSAGSCIFCVFFFPPLPVMLPSEIPHRPACERVFYCWETSPFLQLPPQDRSPSLTLLSLFLSFIFCPTSFCREWGAFLGAWCPPPAFRSCFVEVAQHSNDILMNLWRRKWSPRPILPPSLDRPHLF